MTVFVQVHAYVSVHACVWRPEISLRCFPWEPSILIFKTGSLTGNRGLLIRLGWPVKPRILGLADQARPANQCAPGTLLSLLLPQHSDYKCTPRCLAFYLGIGDQSHATMLVQWFLYQLSHLQPQMSCFRGKTVRIPTLIAILQCKPFQVLSMGSNRT